MVVSAQTRPERPPATPLGELADWLRGASPTTSRRRVTSDTVVTGLTLSSQRSFPGDLYAALPGSRAHGMTYAAEALAGGAVALLTDPAGAADAPDGVPLLVVAEPRRILGRLAARVYGDPAAAMRMIGVTGTQGKTTTTRLAEGGLRGRRGPGRRDRHGRHPDRGGGREDLAHHSGGARPARAVRGDARARRRGLRDGGEQPRAGDGSRRRRGLRRRGLPQPRPRPPRLPRRRGGLLPRQGVAVHAGAGPARARQRRRRARPAAGRRDHAAAAHLLDRGQGRGLDGGRRTAGPGRLDVPRPRPRRRRRGRRPAPGRVQREQRAGGRGRVRRGRAGRRGGGRGDRRRRRGPRPVRADRRGPAVHGRRRLRAQARRRPGRAGEPAPAHRRPADRGPRRRRRPRPRQAAAHGRPRRPARRRGRRDRRQPAHRGPGRHPGRGARGRPRRHRAGHRGGRPTRRHRHRARPRPARRHRRRGRQGPRDRPGGRRGGAPLRRPRGGPRAAGWRTPGPNRQPVVGGPRRTPERRTESWASGRSGSTEGRR